ncbi:MAG: YggS family pyridoxal phosphate-dependent enzyme [Alphaproteobacteria bacterium]|nr:YggS family pyridoxal phosphate-dependent enzyme [Alphaproteobacteria bacterium]
MASISANLEALRHRIAAAAKAAGRDPSGVRLIAVSKFQPLEAVKAALAAGQTCFGENRVQEAKGKFVVLRAEHPELELHLIGPLQTNKAGEAVRLFDVIQTLDRPQLAAALTAAIKKTGKTPRLYVEVNTGDEPQKSGVLPEVLDGFLGLCRGEHGLKIEGLMCIPPVTDNPEPHFRLLKQMADKHGLPHISMGMSADFEAAIRCGATEVRVGTAVFGERKP